MEVWLSLAIPLFLSASPVDPDTDGDGLSDYREIYKYFTDPTKTDSDGDGAPDGDWEERREYTYTVQAVIQVLPPVNPEALEDDYQDGRILKQTNEYVEIEVILYPFNTNAHAISGKDSWRQEASRLKEFLKPGPTSNWDEPMRKQLVKELKEKGIDAAKLEDKKLVEKASLHLLQRTNSEDSFTTFAVKFENGKPKVAPGMQEKVREELKKTGRTLEEQWQRELFGKGMFENKIHGTCTSTAIYLQTGLRALGIPTRTIVCVPVVDASDPKEVEVLREKLTHRGVRKMLEQSVAKLGRSWASHTFNEVFVGGRWRRLNYERLGQNILDRDYFGLMVHVHTFRDHAEAGLVTWGMRDASSNKNDVFGGSNPYSAKEISDRFGPHSRVVDSDENSLPVSRIFWANSSEQPESYRVSRIDDDPSGHLLVHVESPWFEKQDYDRIYEKVSKSFLLRAEGREEVRANAERGFYMVSGGCDFYLRIPVEELGKMAAGADYTLHPQNDESNFRWVVGSGVSIRRDSAAKR